MDTGAVSEFSVFRQDDNNLSWVEEGGWRPISELNEYETCERLRQERGEDFGPYRIMYR